VEGQLNNSLEPARQIATKHETLVAAAGLGQQHAGKQRRCKISTGSPQARNGDENGRKGTFTLTEK